MSAMTTESARDTHYLSIMYIMYIMYIATASYLARVIVLTSFGDDIMVSRDAADQRVIGLYRSTSFGGVPYNSPRVTWLANVTSSWPRQLPQSVRRIMLTSPLTWLGPIPEAIPSRLICLHVTSPPLLVAACRAFLKDLSKSAPSFKFDVASWSSKILSEQSRCPPSTFRRILL